MRTLGSPYLALLLQGQGGVVAEGSGTTILKLVAEASPLSKSVLLILGLLSIISWSIILYKK